MSAMKDGMVRVSYIFYINIDSVVTMTSQDKERKDIAPRVLRSIVEINLGLLSFSVPPFRFANFVTIIVFPSNNKIQKCCL